jgi:hypothetical protein
VTSTKDFLPVSALVVVAMFPMIYIPCKNSLLQIDQDEDEADVLCIKMLLP